MDGRPNGRKKAIEFVWRQPDADLTLSQKQTIVAALAKDTDETATLYFLSPLSENWVCTLKRSIEPTGAFHCTTKFAYIFTKNLRSISQLILRLWELLSTFRDSCISY